MTSIYTAMQKGTLPALILAGLISFHSYPTKAERVNVEIATQVARVAINGGKLSTRSTNDIRLVYQPTSPQNPLRTATDAAEYYVFNATSQEGFVIILISANNVDSCVINGYFVKISNLNVPYIT